jgi:uncharacterized protein (DUF169 family)
MDWTNLEPSPVGVRVLTKAASAPLYQGVSYCDAVRRAGEGETLRVLPGSIQVCRWAPVVLGLKEPRGRFEKHLTPRLSCPVVGLLLAPLDRFPGEPDVVIVRTNRETLQTMLASLGHGQLWAGHEGKLDRSAVPLFVDGRATAHHRLVGVVNRSVCRNSTAIPLLTGRVNVSFFCTGGITWGRNRPDHLTSGWPWPVFQNLEGTNG